VPPTRLSALHASSPPPWFLRFPFSSPQTYDLCHIPRGLVLFPQKTTPCASMTIPPGPLLLGLSRPCPWFPTTRPFLFPKGFSGLPPRGFVFDPSDGRHSVLRPPVFFPPLSFPFLHDKVLGVSCLCVFLRPNSALSP